jgi:hypothetical protein
MRETRLSGLGSGEGETEPCARNGTPPRLFFDFIVADATRPVADALGRATFAEHAPAKSIRLHSVR